MSVFDPLNPLEAFFSHTEAAVIAILAGASHPLTRPAFSRTGLERKSVLRAIERLEPLGLLRRIQDNGVDTYELNTKHVLYEPIRQTYEAGRRLQGNLDTLMKHGWTAHWSGEAIHLVAPGDRADRAEQAERGVKAVWKQWTGQDIEVHTTIRPDSDSSSA